MAACSSQEEGVKVAVAGWWPARMQSAGLRQAGDTGLHAARAATGQCAQLVLKNC